jgi:hypothetical protein
MTINVNLKDFSFYRRIVNYLKLYKFIFFIKQWHIICFEIDHYLAIETKTSQMRVHLLRRALTTNGMRNRAAREKRHSEKF